MSLHRPRRPYSLPYALRKLAAAEASLASWQGSQPIDWRARADRHRAIEKWTLEVLRWRRIAHPTVEAEFRPPF